MKLFMKGVAFGMGWGFGYALFQILVFLVVTW
jgi:hypothetical protein